MITVHVNEDMACKIPGNTMLVTELTCLAIFLDPYFMLCFWVLGIMRIHHTKHPCLWYTVIAGNFDGGKL